MTTDEMRVAVAEVCGWRNVRVRDEDGWIEGTTSLGARRDVPHYDIDLNEMAKAEETLFPTQVHQLNEPDRFAEYHARLDMMCVGHPGGAIRATAAQRCEAFLRATGRWKDEVKP